MKTALTIAGSDSGGGAGIQADLKAFQANGVFGMSAITAITAQNTVAVTAAEGVALPLIRAQIDAVFDDLPVHAVKTGMLPTRAVVDCVVEALADREVPFLVIDPVMVSSTGFDLIDSEAERALVTGLFPRATVITPNTREAERLLGTPVRTLDEARAAVVALGRLGACAVLLKGGHLEDGDDSVDLLWDGERVHAFSAPRIATQNTHGTGCTTAASLAANLAKGHSLVESVRRTKRYVHGAISAGLDLGRGHGPTHHFWFLSGSGLFPADD
ncbi:MAG: bifunctional hydroxymethylpyrimidine kinase/phosphomethylpyrimidine kinase [Myxococcota bacterium]